MKRSHPLGAAVALLLIAGAACAAPRPTGAAAPQLGGCAIFPPRQRLEYASR
jgi:hypothetical protein